MALRGKWLVSALFGSRVLESLICGISALDRFSYGIAIAVIIAAAILACWRPATQASANAVDAIRAE